MSRKRILRALSEDGYGIDDIRGIFITHAHRDHIGGFRVLMKDLDIPVYATVDTIDHITRRYAREVRGLKNPGKYKSMDDLNFIEVEPGNEIYLGGLRVMAFELHHDIRGAVGYRFMGDVELTMITDTGIVDDTMQAHLLDSDNILIEANHDPVMLAQSQYPHELQRRIAGPYGHLSNVQAHRILRTILERRVPENIILGHISDNTNTTDTVYIDVARPLMAFGGNWHVVPNGHGTGLIG